MGNMLAAAPQNVRGDEVRNTKEIDIAANRRDVRYSRSVLAKRFLWGLARPLFRITPRRSFKMRNLILRLFGARIGREVHIYNSAVIYMPWNLQIGELSSIGEWALIYNLGRVSIGEKATISHRAHLCAGTHECEDPRMPLLKPPIMIGAGAWICADAFVGPGVSIGEGAVVGARAVAVKDAGPWEIVAGNPARVIGRRNIKRSEENI
jgi:putative colanic acid biosynthesis acetyltransferase WcaF